MFYRIVVDIFNVPFQGLIIADLMLPKSALPNRLLAFPYPGCRGSFFVFWIAATGVY